MKGMIDSNGNLRIERRGRMVTQFCPFKDGIPCGDHCPQFGKVPSESTRIDICMNRALYFETLTIEK